MIHFLLEVLKFVAGGIVGLYLALTLFCLGLAITVNWRAALLPLALLFEAAFSVVGFVAVPIAAALNATEYRPSQRFPERLVLSWRWWWMWVFGNEEDGIDGTPLDKNTLRNFRNVEWRTRTYSWSEWRRIVVWAAFRNGVSNLRYTKWGLLIDPRKVVVHLNSNTEWFVSQGWRSNYWYQGRRWRVWIGWPIKPWDYSPFDAALTEGDPRSAGVGFKLQFKRAR